MAQNRVYKFGVFELNLAARELRKHGVRIRLSGQPFALLGILLESSGQIVTREEMRLRLWSTDTIVDFEHSLNSAIKKLRAALGDSPENSRYVETVPKIGYRFIAPVEAVEQEIATQGLRSVPDTNQTSYSGGETNSGRARLPLWIWIAAAGAMVLAIVALSRTLLHRAPSGMQSSSRVMIAVLPFENLTGNSSEDYFSDGLTEEMIEQLGRVDPKHLGVIARASVLRYQREGASLEKIKRELGVQYVLEGTVRRDADRVRVTAELIQLKDQSHVWSREYDRSLDKLLILQGEIAQQLARELSLSFSPNPAPRKGTTYSPESYQAYDLYLKGRYFWNKRSKDGFERAVTCFQESIEKDPTYARSYAGLADTYALIGAYNFEPVAEVADKAKAAARMAVELDESLSESHTALALIAQNIDWDWATAEKEYKRAIELDPNYATAHHWYAEELSLVGRFDEALVEIERARQLDPLSLIIATDRAAILYYGRQYDASIQQFRAVIDMEPTFPRSHIIENVFVQKKMYAEAMSDAEAWERTGVGPWSVAVRAYLYGRTNQRAKALEQLSLLNERYETFPAITYLRAFPSLGLDDKEAALTWLERSYADHSISTNVAVEPIFDPLRGEQRFQAILEKMHFPATGGVLPSSAHK
jgi:TolB-like protein/DNA-binding winged helix-turn-helix (wHTH) protein/Tfp pilus assembly protein PilF